MKLELKSVKIGPGSEETLQFTADLFVDGKKVAYCDNDGHGGSTNIQPYAKEFWPLMEKAEKFCSAMPPIKLDSGFEIPMNLEHWVDDQAYKVDKEKENKSTLNKFNRLSKDKILIFSRKDYDDYMAGKPIQLRYKTIGYPHPFERYSPEAKQTIVDRAKAQLIGDEFIYNKNLPL